MQLLGVGGFFQALGGNGWLLTGTTKLVGPTIIDFNGNTLAFKGSPTFGNSGILKIGNAALAGGDGADIFTGTGGAGFKIRFLGNNGNNLEWTFRESGNSTPISLLIGSSGTASAWLQIVGSAAGAAGTGSLKINQGVALSTPENDLVENIAGHLFFTTGGKRVQLDLQVSEVTISSAQILNGFTAPVTLLAAQGAGKIIQVIGPIISKYSFGTIAYATNTDAYVSAAGLNTLLVGILAGGVSRYAYQNLGDVVGALATFENLPVNWQVAVGNPTAGDGTVKVHFKYLILTL